MQAVPFAGLSRFRVDHMDSRAAPRSSISREDGKWKAHGGWKNPAILRVSAAACPRQPVTSAGPGMARAETRRGSGVAGAVARLIHPEPVHLEERLSSCAAAYRNEQVAMPPGMATDCWGQSVPVHCLERRTMHGASFETPFRLRSTAPRDERVCRRSGMQAANLVSTSRRSVHSPELSGSLSRACNKPRTAVGFRRNDGSRSR